jgi:Zn-dependent protease
MDNFNLIQNLIILVPPILLAVTLHEVAHGWMALRCGDTTAWAQGRLSLNPLRHVDPVGTVLVPGILFFLGGFIFGWAKPVPVNYYHLQHPKQDMALVALAGPGANLTMAIGWALVMVAGKLVYLAAPWLGIPLYFMGHAGVEINIVIGVLNMLPVPPLDGSRVLAGLLPDGFGRLMMKLEPYGLVVMLLLLTSGVLNIILRPPIYWLQKLLFSIFGP